MRERVTVVYLSFIRSLCQQRMSKMADVYALREEELRLDDNLSPFNLPLLFNFGLDFEKVREKAENTVSVAI